MNYKSIIEAMKRVPATATDEIFIEHEVWETIICAMDDMMRKIEKLESSKGGMFVDKKTKDALITIVRHVLDSDKKTEDPAALERDALVKQYEDRIAETEREHKEEVKKYHNEMGRYKIENRNLMDAYHEATAKNIANWDRANQLEEENKKLQEQADLDKMQIALYDKENKELRQKFAVLKEISRKAYSESLAVTDVPEESVYACDDVKKKREAWGSFLITACECKCKEERTSENRDS